MPTKTMIVDSAIDLIIENIKLNEKITYFRLLDTQILINTFLVIAACFKVKQAIYIRSNLQANFVSLYGLTFKANF